MPSTRRLSPLRLGIAVIVTAAVVTGGVLWGKTAISDAVSPTISPWFAAYVDVTATPQFAFEAPASDAAKNVVLSFVVSDASNACAPSWGTAYSLDEASVDLDLDRRIARLQQQGGEAIVSFGGAANTELAVGCTDASALQKAYSTVIDRYDLSTIDLDLEGAGLSATAADRRATAIAAIQSQRRDVGDDLAVWLTLPVTSDGLSTEGTDAVAAMLKAGVDIAGVNGMTMDYGDSLGTQTMIGATTAALGSLRSQLDVLYSNAGTNLSNKTLWSKVGATPMIGQNDVASEVFTLKAAKALNAFALDNGLGRVSMWSLNRDMTCGPNYVDLTTVSDSCSGIDQGEKRFAEVLGNALTGSPEAVSTVKTTPEPVETEAADDPATSPYAIWAEGNTYLLGTKVVWHRNVYEAKWWTKGDVPDNPVLQASDTPWTLIGPVLPGETPEPVPTLPAGTYKDWSGKATYEEGDRVLLDGVPYEAKWWTQGDSPEAAAVDSESSPWLPLTLAQINEVLAGG